jgi:hypothetical protein
MNEGVVSPAKDKVRDVQGCPVTVKGRILRCETEKYNPNTHADRELVNCKLPTS